MGQAIIVGVVLGLFIALELSSRARRATEREAQQREQIAGILMYAELTAAIESVDFALRAEDPKWLVSMSETTTLSEAWREHAEALAGLGPARWAIVDEAVSVPARSLVLSSFGCPSQIEDVKRSLAERRERLIAAAQILHDLHQPQARVTPAPAARCLGPSRACGDLAGGPAVEC